MDGKLPDGCGYMGQHFGAPYVDAECFGGQLYDIDDGDDDGNLCEPGEYIPCPKCKPQEFAKYERRFEGEEQPAPESEAR